MQVTKTLIDKAVFQCGSASKLAQRIGIHRQMVTDWKNEKCLPTEEQVAKMAELVGVRIEEALLARSIDALTKTDEGRRLVEVMKRGFLVGALAILPTFSSGATPILTKACQVGTDIIYIVLSRLRRYRSALALKRFSIPFFRATRDA